MNELCYWRGKLMILWSCVTVDLSYQCMLGRHPASCKMVTGSFPGVKCGRGVLLTTHLLLVPRSWKSRAIPLPTLWATLGLYLYLLQAGQRDLPVVKISPEWVTGPEQGKSSGRIATNSPWMAFPPFLMNRRSRIRLLRYVLPNWQKESW